MKNLMDGEQELFSGAADTLYFKTLRRATINLTVTNKRVVIGSLFAPKEYLLGDIISVKRFKSMFMNIGISFELNNGKTVNLATRHIKNLVEVLEKLGKL